MSSASSRRSFYPLPPSVYPQPLVDPCSAMETTYGHNHCQHVKQDDFFRSRTLNPGAIDPSLRPKSAASIAHANQGIYPRHGTGQFVIPYYRRDSKGYRKSYQQPLPIDQHYTATQTVTGLINGGFQFTHPSSRPTYSASKSGAMLGSTGATFSTSYRNSGLYDATSNHTSRVPRVVGEGLAYNRTIQQQQQRQRYENQSQFSATQPQLATVGGQPSTSSRSQEFGYYTQEIADQPPVGAEIYPDGYESNLVDRTPTSSHAILGDPLLADPLANAHRKPRTVYKRSFGKCQ